MHRVKKAIANLRHYLGRDTHGIALLGEVSTIADALRKDVAALKDSVEKAEQEKAVAVAAAVTASSEIDTLTAALARESALREQREHTVRALEAETAKLREQLNPSDDDETEQDAPTEMLSVNKRGFIAAFKALRRQMRTAPVPIGRVEPTKKSWRPSRHLDYKHPYAYPVYQMSDILKGYTTADFQKLGLFVGCLTVMNMSCILAADSAHTFCDGRTNDEIDLDPLLTKFMRWYRTNIKWDLADEPVDMKAERKGLTHRYPGMLPGSW